MKMTILLIISCMMWTAKPGKKISDMSSTCRTTKGDKSAKGGAPNRQSTVK